jgi:hypothetical protein
MEEKMDIKARKDTENQEALLPCPFCGEVPRYDPWCAGHEPPHHWPHQIVHACNSTGVQMCVRAGKIGLEDTKENVFAAWNTRANINGMKEK